MKKRDYKKENEKRKATKERIVADLDKELGLKLKEELKNEGKTINEWIRIHAISYIDSNNVIRKMAKELGFKEDKI